MPTIQLGSPLGAASEAVGAYAEKKESNRDKALALAMEREKRASDEKFRTRQLDLQQMSVESEVESRRAQTEIAKAQEAYRKSIEPILRQLVQAQLAGTLSENEMKAAQAQVAQIDAQTAAELQRLGLPVKTAQAQLAQVQQQTATALAQQHSAEATTEHTKLETKLLPGKDAREAAESKARVSASGASEAYTRALTGQVGKTGTGGSTGALEGGLGEYASLSPQGQKIVDDVAEGRISAREGALRAAKLPKERDKIVDSFSKVGNDALRPGKHVDPLVQNVVNFIATKPVTDRLRILVGSDTFKNATPDQQNEMLKGVKALP